MWNGQKLKVKDYFGISVKVFWGRQIVEQGIKARYYILSYGRYREKKKEMIPTFRDRKES